MKFILKNNQGYALLTVLLTITVFGVLSIALISNSFSSTKQNAMAEKKSQSIELAEMGAKYFEYAVKNAANDLIQSVRTEIETEQRTTGDVANPKEHFTERSIEILIEKLDDEINTVTVPMKNKTNASFTIDQISFVKSETGDELIVTSKSIGNNNGKTSEITASVTISFANFITMVQGANQTPSPTLLVDLPPELTITFPSNIINGCTFTNEFDYSSKSCRDPRDIITGSNFNELKFNESIVKLKSMDVNGNMNFPISKSTIYVENNVDFKKSVRFTGSNLYVGGDINFSMSDGLTIENQSNLYVNGFADFNKVVDIKGNSNIYVGNADFKKNTSINNSFLYVKGNPSEDVKVTFHETLNITNNSRVYVTDDTYLKKGFTLNQSILHIKGYTDVDDAINLNNNAKLCVDGVFDPKHNVNINKDNSSKIYAKSTTYTKNSTYVNTNPADFEKECSCNAPSSDQTISWGTMDISPKFDYSY
ncbi:type II secretion system protein [Bacillus sp. DNRA2]|uniref:type II secretion system protein n=1 Tax=Bacillus sp. DNRA2 TaxID=2723053 RepID=UPI00145DC5B8|nr:type II secretion system protein [Bacillus sp. DNRA2]NMD70528.1 type II secretion system protein [Bacillus sp. DNRA2]